MKRTRIRVMINALLHRMMLSPNNSDAAASVATIFPYPTWHCTARHVTEVEIEQQGMVRIIMSRLPRRPLLSRDVKCAAKTFPK
jgi:hypothetical protein